MIEESKMDIKEMTRQLEIIFENQIERDYQSFYKYRPKNRHPITSSRISGGELRSRIEEYKEKFNLEISRNPQDYIVENENLELLIELYERIKEDSYLIGRFRSFLSDIIAGKKYKNASYLAFFLSYKIGELDHAFFIFESYFDVKSTSVTYILLTMGDILVYDHPNIKDEQLDKIKKYFHQAFPKISALPLKHYVEVEKMLSNLKLTLSGSSSTEIAVESLNKVLIKRIIKLITDIQFYRLQRLYRETDSEIKEHQKIVEKQIVDLGMSEEISEALAWCRKKYDAISDDKFEISSAIGELREIWSKFKKEMSLKINKEEGTEIPKRDGTPEYVKYITDSLDLKNEKKLIGGLQKILNSEGGHALASEKLYFKLTLNILVEVIYLINEKYKDWEKKR